MFGGASQVQQAANTLADSFLNYPLYAVIFPEECTRHRNGQILFRFLLTYGTRYGRVRTSSTNMESVSIWLPPEAPQMTLLRQIRCGGLVLAWLGFQNLLRLIRISLKIDKTHSELAKEPHYYLACLGTAPLYHGHGHASRLIKDFLQTESNGYPCYLETFFLPNVSFYERLGFKLLSTNDMPGTGLTLYAMAYAK